MAHSDKNILITPNIGSTTADPKIVFSGADASTGAQNITLQVYPTNSGTLSFEGSAGQLFSITNSLSGTIYSVNDISGIPSIEVLDTGLVKLGQYSGNILLGSDTGEAKLQVTGGGFFTGSIGTSRTTRGVYVGLSPAGDPQIQLQGNGATNPHIDFDNGTGDYDMRIILTGDDILNITGGALTIEGNTVWHAGNDGSGSGLDADTVDGLNVHTGRNNSANQIVRTDGNGYIQAGYINSSNGNEGNASSPARVWGTNGSDDYMRTYQTAYLDVKSAYLQYPTGTSNDWVTSFQNIPAHSSSFREMSGNGPTGTWWFMQNFRHSNSSNYWGTQLAWGWEDNANQLYQRNITGNSWGSWVKYWNSYNDGSGSGLDADTLDGLHASSFAQAMLQVLSIDSNGNLNYDKYDGTSTATIVLKNTALNFTGSGTLSFSSNDLILTL